MKRSLKAENHVEKNVCARVKLHTNLSVNNNNN